MKCPFQEVTRYYTKQRRLKHCGFTSRHEWVTVGCSPSQASSVVKSFNDCVKNECPFYSEINGVENCSRVGKKEINENAI